MDAAQVDASSALTSLAAPHWSQVLSGRSQEFCTHGLQDCLHPFSSVCADPNDRR